MLTTVLAATFWVATSHFADGSSLSVSGGSSYGQACYYSMRATCADASRCEAATAMAKATATLPQCGYVQPIAAPREVAGPIDLVE